MARVTVGRALNPKDDYRSGFAIHIPGRKYRVLVDPAQFELVLAWFNPFDRSAIMGEQRYKHWREQHRVARNARRGRR